MNNILGYPVVRQIETPAGTLPLVDIPMMSDEHWNELAEEHVVKNYIRVNRKEPESVKAAFGWQREWLESLAT